MVGEGKVIGKDVADAIGVGEDPIGAGNFCHWQPACIPNTSITR